jgi:hypothetical protein
MTAKAAKYGIPVVFLLLAAIQFIQPGRGVAFVDPARSFEAVGKPSGEVASVLRRACYDCHSNATVWPWYSRVAPVSWLIASDVNEGRARLNFSEWSFYSPERSRTRLVEMCREVRKRAMPPLSYRLMHPEATLTDEDIGVLCGASGSGSK